MAERERLLACNIPPGSSHPGQANAKEANNANNFSVLGNFNCDGVYSPHSGQDVCNSERSQDFEQDVAGFEAEEDVDVDLDNFGEAPVRV